MQRRGEARSLQTLGSQGRDEAGPRFVPRRPLSPCPTSQGRVCACLNVWLLMRAHLQRAGDGRVFRVRAISWITRCSQCTFSPKTLSRPPWSPVTSSRHYGFSPSAASWYYFSSFLPFEVLLMKVQQLGH